MILSRRAPVDVSSSSSQGVTASQGQDSRAGAAGVAGILSSTGSVFEGESGKRYARAVEGIVVAAATGLADCDAGVSTIQLSQRRLDLLAER